VQHAQAIRARLGAARADLDAIASGASGVLRIGAVPSVAGALIPPLARELRRRGPGITLHVFESNLPSILFEALGRGELDLVLAPLTEPIDGLEAEELMSDPYVLLVSVDDPLAMLGRAVRPDDLAGRELIGKDVTSPSQRDLEYALERLGVGTTTRIRAHDARTVHALVGCGLGLAVVPRLVMDDRDDSTRALPLDHLVADRRIGVYERDGGYRSPGIALAREVIGELATASRT
jgi:DNA-binding transcriptional LysR family regulator